MINQRYFLVSDYGLFSGEELVPF